jgi:HlyD family secretion protein
MLALVVRVQADPDEKFAGHAAADPSDDGAMSPGTAAKEPDLHAGQDLRSLVDQETRRRSRRRVIGWSIAGLVIAALGTTIYVTWPEPPQPDELYRLGEVQRATLVRRTSATGHLEARSSVDVGAKISGTIAEVLVDEGDVVKRDQVLARFEDEKLDAQSDQARASVKAAKASLKQAKIDRKQAARDLARVQTLAAKGVESPANVEKAQTALDELDARIGTLEAQVSLQSSSRDLADMTLRDAAIVAPIDGVILTREVDPGQTVAATFQTPVLFTVAEDLARMRVVADVDEADIAKVAVGQAATFTVDAFPQREFDAKVVQVRNAAQVVTGVVTYEVLLDVENAEGQLRPGMTTTVKITTAEATDVLCVPNGALRFTPPRASLGEGAGEGVAANGGGVSGNGGPSGSGGVKPSTPTIWVLDGTTPKPVEVETGISDGRRTEVSGAGLDEGARVLVDLTTLGREVFAP